MSFQDAVALWGEEAVRKALAESSPPPSEALLAELEARVEAHAEDAGAIARWALSLSWEHFCGVVKVVAGDELARELGEGL